MLLGVASDFATGLLMGEETKVKPVLSVLLNVEPLIGLEPMTYALRERCSTN